MPRPAPREKGTFRIFESTALPRETAVMLADFLAETLAQATVSCFETTPQTWRVRLYDTDPAADGAHDPGLSLETIQTLVRLAPCRNGEPPVFSQDVVAHEDWVKKSLATLTPVHVGCFIVHGSHDRDTVQALIDASRARTIAIEIDAAQGFGTGHHASTAGCLEALDRLCHQRSFSNVLDLGTGSGVLAIAMAKAQNCRVLASDCDRVAIMSAGANVAINGVGAHVETVCAAGFDDPVFAERAPFDLIMANILASPLIVLAPDIARHCNRQSIVVLAGLLNTQRDTVVDAFLAQGLHCFAPIERGDWTTLVLRRSGC